MTKKKQASPVEQAPIPPPLPMVNVSGNMFYGVKWDEKATAAVQTIAEAMREDARAAHKRAEAALALCEVFRASNVKIDCLLKVASP